MKNIKEEQGVSSAEEFKSSALFAFVKKRIEKEQEKIQSKLHNSVELFRYWARYIKTYKQKKYELGESEASLENLRLQSEAEAKASHDLRKSTKDAKRAESCGVLEKAIHEFKKGNKVQSKVIKNFFELFIEKEKIDKNTLSLLSFKDIDIDVLLEEGIRKELLELETKKGLKEGIGKKKAITKNIKIIKEAISSYQQSLKKDANIEFNSQEKIADLKKDIKEIEELDYKKDSVDSPGKKGKDSPNKGLNEQNEPKANKDSTNFAAAEIGFVVTINGESDIPRYYHYPVTFPKKNTFSISDLENELYNYLNKSGTKTKYGNHITDESILTCGEARGTADPSNDYHSETALFLLMQDNAFQNKVINQLIKELLEKSMLLKKSIEKITISELVISIHSTNDICSQCFKKAKDLVDYKNQKQAHFLTFFKNKIFNLLNKEFGINKDYSISNSSFDIKIDYSYSYDYGKAETKTDASIIRKNLGTLDQPSDEFRKNFLYQYSIITSGGTSEIKKSNHYAPAYNEAIKKVKDNSGPIIKGALINNMRILTVKKIIQKIIDDIIENSDANENHENENALMGDKSCSSKDFDSDTANTL